MAKLFRPTLILARFAFLHETVIPTSDSESQVQGCNNKASLGHLKAGPGGMYSPLDITTSHKMETDNVSCGYFIFSALEKGKIR